MKSLNVQADGHVDYAQQSASAPDAGYLRVFAEPNESVMAYVDSAGTKFDLTATSSGEASNKTLWSNSEPQADVSSLGYKTILNFATPGKGSLTLPAGSLLDNAMFEINFSGRYTVAIANKSVIFAVFVDGQTHMEGLSTALVVNATAEGFSGSINLSCRTSGNDVVLYPSGQVSMSNLGNPVSCPIVGAGAFATPIDPNIPHTVDVRVLWSAANADIINTEYSRLSKTH
jgi:hypothetical protein